MLRSTLIIFIFHVRVLIFYPKPISCQEEFVQGIEKNLYKFDRKTQQFPLGCPLLAFSLALGPALSPKL